VSSWIILGTSPFIDTITDWSFTKKYTTIAVNNFNRCPVDYRVANDISTMFTVHRNKLPGKRLFHRNNLKTLAGKNDVSLFQPYKTYLWSRDWTFKEDHLCCRHTSAMAGINYAMKEGAKEVVLIGIDLNWTNEDRGSWRIGEMCGLIGKATKYIEVYRVNPQEELPLSWLPLRRLEEL
jgi:hypothetical protein